MVMAFNHATSCAALWLHGRPIVEAAIERPLTTTEVLVGAALAAGAGLIPDLDTLRSTVSNAFGVVSQTLSVGVTTTSVMVQNLTLGPRDEPTQDGHRFFTHTAVFAGLLSAAVYAACSTWGRAAVLTLLFVLLSLAVRTLAPDAAKAAAKASLPRLMSSGILGGIGTLIGVSMVAGAATFAAAVTLPEGGSYEYLAATMFIGCLGHCLGDMITKERAPLLWPLPIRGKLWYDVGLPSWLTITADGPVEKLIVTPVMGCLLLLGVLMAVNPDLVAGMLSAVS